MKKIIFFLLNVCLLQQIKAQTTSPTFDPAWASRMQNIIDNEVAKGSVKGVSVAVFVPGQGTFIGTGGESTTGVPITPDMQFCIASNTKLFTAVLVLKLNELGLLSLNDRLSDWLPSYPYIDGSATIRQCLSHQTGFFDLSNDIDPSVFEAIVYGPDTFYTPAMSLALMGPPHFSPGEAYSYSNTNYTLAALIIEAATGNTYAENLHQYIFDPLDMDSSFLAAYESPNGNVAHGWYSGDDLGNIPLTALHSLNWSAAAIFSTANEMLQWYQQLFAGNVISQSSLNEISNFEPSSIYGLGLVERSWVNGDIVSPLWVHDGLVPGYSSDIAFNLRNGSMICVLANDKNRWSVTLPIVTEAWDNYPRKEHDAGIETIISPAQQKCSSVINPEIKLINLGLSPLQTVNINYQVDGGTTYTHNWSGNLVTDAKITVNLPALTVSSGSHSFKCFTSHPNGNAEGYTYNDSVSSYFNIAISSLQSSLQEGFEGTEFPPPGWLIGNKNILSWQRSSLSLLHGNGSAVKNNWIDATGKSHELELPVMNLSSLNNPVLSFKYAYGYYAQGHNDALSVMVSTDCGATYHNAFNKSGQSLKTADAEDVFFPDDNEWRLKAINFSAYKNSNVMIKFKVTNANGNNLFLDNVEIADKSEICSSPTDLDALQITSSSAKLNWQVNGNPIKFDVYYRPVGSSTWSLKNVAGNKRWVIINNLLSDTDYDWYIIATCSQVTSIASEISLFTTDAESFVTTASPLQKNSETIQKANTLNIYPNPVSASATISFSVSKPEKISLIVYDITGKLIRTIANREFYEGTHQIRIDTEKMSTGIYILKLQSNGILQTKKFIVQH